MTIYKAYRNTLKRITRKAKIEYYNNKCVEVKNNMKNLWFIINHAMGKYTDKTTMIDSLKVNNIVITGPKLIANEMAKYFANVGKKYTENIAQPNRNIDQYLSKISNCNKSLFIHPTTRVEILSIINKLPNKKSSGPDGLSNCMLKDLKEVLITPLEIHFNQSMAEGIFPDQMKQANVVPLHKVNSKQETTNYRPISLLLTMSKILEKLMYKRIYNFMSNNNLFFTSQHGFRNKYSCESAVSELIGNICKGHEKGKHTLAIFIDLSKAFEVIIQ